MSSMTGLKNAFAENNYERATDVLSGTNPDNEGLVSLSAAFMFLSLVYRYPDAPVYDTLLKYISDFQSFADEYSAGTLELTDRREMEYDYVRLFINAPGGMKANPYASCWLSEEKLLWGDKMIRLKELMEAEGFVMSAPATELEDHISVVLEFCSVLTEKIAAGSGSCSVGSFFTLLEIMRDFFPAFAGSFAAKVTEEAEQEFYKTAGRLVQGFLADAEQIFEELIFG
ncbi:MAG: molecular chaperone TorD family protein [Geovibrio sp.]|nr:molecular chaperone TorD family protein [Geovibrio sp.]MCD8569757.1 molecular chaperone TorD family protein [Geovibrio sp.]